MLVTFFLANFSLSVYHSIFYPTIASPAATRERVSVNRTLMVCFVTVIGSDELQSRFNVCALNSRNFLEWVRAFYSPSARKIVRVLTDKARRRGQGKGNIAEEVKSTMFKDGEDVVLRELRLEHVRQTICEVVAVWTNRKKYKSVINMFLQLFQKKKTMRC